MREREREREAGGTDMYSPTPNGASPTRLATRGLRAVPKLGGLGGSLPLPNAAAEAGSWARTVE